MAVEEHQGQRTENKKDFRNLIGVHIVLDSKTQDVPIQLLLSRLQIVDKQVKQNSFIYKLVLKVFKTTGLILFNQINKNCVFVMYLVAQCFFFFCFVRIVLVV